MPDHYYTQTPSSAHDEREISVDVLGQALRFATDAGVFSKTELDFGSRLLLESLPPLTGRALDLGCGWGALGIALAKANPEALVEMSDVNQRAVELAGRNIQLNGVRNARAVLSDGFAAVEGGFDFVISNPPIRAGKRVIYAMFDEARNRLNPGGALFIVIRKQQGAPSALAHLREVYGNAEMIARDKGFWVIRAGI